MDAHQRLQYLSLVIARRWVLGCYDLPEPYLGVEEDAALVAQNRERQQFPVAPPIDKEKMAEGEDEREREIILTTPDWLLAVWRFFPPFRAQDSEHWTRLRAEGRSHLGPWWTSDLPGGGDPVPWPPDPSGLWEGRF